MSGAVPREIVTPEGVPLRFEVADVFARYSAFVLDGTLIILGTVSMALLAGLLGLFTSGGQWFLALFLLASFVLRHGYFIWFETRRQGATPGKRYAGIRVVDRGGGVLTAEAVFARNLTREIEVFLPIILLFNPKALLTEAPAWAALAGSLWVLLLAALPFLNRDRLRIGDMVGGTIVVRSPQAVLLKDLSAAQSAKPREVFTFTPAQLAVYGIYELQVLEEVLRTENADAHGLEAVADRIKKRIGWDRKRWKVPSRLFLQDFYDAQRGHLEGRLLLGQRKERKDEKPRGKSPR